MNSSRVRVYYSGRVQGVGFRYTVKSLVNGFDITGTIRNLADGRVELVAQGTKTELESFRQAIRESGLQRLISHEDENWEPAGDEFRGFRIIS
jgi:acylphosphatase